MVAVARMCILVLALTGVAEGAALKSKTKHSANPIRRVVTMLQMMQKKVEAQGEASEELFEKYICYCKTTDGALTKSITEAEDKIPQLESSIKEDTEAKAQTTGELATHHSDRDAANEAVAKATAMRDKEAAAFAKESAEDGANLEALTKAIAAISKGLGASFLQSNGAATLQKLAKNSQDLLGEDRQLLTAFLTNSQAEDSPGSDEILGILKQLKDEMSKDFAEMKEAEDTAIADFNALTGAKAKEIAAATKAIEEKTAREGELAVELATLKNDLEDTQEGLAEDTKFLAELKKGCELKQKEMDVYKKTMQEELVAIADTIKMLNDDDALELFKKTMPSASSLLQVDESSWALRQQALQLLPRRRSVPLDFIALALRGRKVGFEKVITMIDDMVVLLGKEMKDDEKKKEYCTSEFDKADDTKKKLEREVSDAEKVIEESQETVETLTEELDALKASIADLDVSVARATEQRKKENAEFQSTLASNSAAKALIEMAKNRMQKFYNPKLYKAPPKRELSEEERITLNMGGTLAPTNPPGGIAGTGISASFIQVRAHTQRSDDDEEAPPPPPPAADLTPKKGESGGVLAMMDSLIADITKETTELELEEKDSQGDYEQLMKDAAAKRSADSKAVTEKEAAKAELDAELQAAKDGKKATETELAGTNGFIADLHSECDWLLENFDARKEARANEIDALKKAKAVLSGADYSLVQTRTRTRRLRTAGY